MMTFTRLSQMVTDFGGEVHRYVGDALIATWPLGTSQDNARPIRCLFACQDALAAAGSDLLRRHGHLPGFRASIHSGPLVAGDIFVICSDGLTAHVRDDEILAEVTGTGAQAACDGLVALALERGGTDNVTVMVVHYSPAPPTEFGAGRLAGPV